jgi:hypothetical protein
VDLTAYKGAAIFCFSSLPEDGLSQNGKNKSPASHPACKALRKTSAKAPSSATTKHKTLQRQYHCQTPLATLTNKEIEIKTRMII